MAQQIYPPNVIIHNILSAFFKYKGLTLTSRGAIPDVAPRAFTSDEIISDMEQFHYVRLDALRTNPRGVRDVVVVLVLATDGKYTHHGPDLRQLIEGVNSERLSKDGRLDEIIIVAEEAFFSKKNLTDVIRTFQAKQVGGPDIDGGAPFYSAHPYYIFSCVVPENHSVPPHRILTLKEVEDFLRAEYLTYRDLPVIYTTDPPIIWLGGREGQVAHIMRYSQTAGATPYLRRIEKGAL